MPHRHQNQNAQNEEVNAMQDANPFTMKNVVIGIVAALVTAAIIGLVASCYNSIKDSEQQTRDAVTKMWGKVSDTHDVIVAHGFKLDAMQADINTLKENCVDLGTVDDHIRKYMNGSTPTHGGGSMAPTYQMSPATSAVVASTNSYE